MKSSGYITSPITAAMALLLLTISSCQKLGESGGSDGDNESVSYPVSRLITDANGRELQVEILGRSDDQITIVRQSDSSRFDLPILKLSAADQSFVKRLPLKSAPKVASANSTVNSTTPRYIQVRIEDIAQMKRDIEFKKAEIKSKTLNPILTSTRRTQINDLENEIKRITLDIETYKRNNKL
ncbi:hypothetical protein OAK43_04815 [Verrucomicrobiales bacterium]|nr:hypothetical protein [Verrucomicrobiales bacterium]